MARLRFLQSVIIDSLNEVPGFNDELDIEDEKVVDYLVENGYADKLIEEKTEEKAPKNTPKRGKKGADLDA